MGDVIKDDLKFNSDADKQAWIKESTKWRLPYWDWALAANKGNVPALFIPELVKIRVPAATDGSQLAPETVKNPLYRYQLHVNGVPTKMGELPEPYKVDDVKLKDGTILPVRMRLPRNSATINFLSGRNALAQADGASNLPSQRTGLKVSTTMKVYQMPLTHMSGFLLRVIY